MTQDDDDNCAPPPPPSLCLNSRKMVIEFSIVLRILKFVLLFLSRLTFISLNLIILRKTEKNLNTDFKYWVSNP